MKKVTITIRPEQAAMIIRHNIELTAAEERRMTVLEAVLAGLLNDGDTVESVTKDGQVVVVRAELKREGAPVPPVVEG